MATSIFLSAFIFGLLVFVIVYFLQLDVFTGLLIALGGSALFILFQYAVGPAIVAATARLHYLQPGENPWLESIVKELADKSVIPMPKLATVPNNTPNAFTFGRTTSSATLAVHEGLLQQLNQNEIKGVIAFAAYIITFLIVMRLSRLREHYADAYSAYVTGSPRELESALAKITYGLSISPKAPEGARAFYIEAPGQAKQEVQRIMEQKDQYDLDHDGVLDERELHSAMEKESKSTWVRMNSLFAKHPPP